MQVGHYLEFACPQCQSPIIFSLITPLKNKSHIECLCCNKQYAFNHHAIHQLCLFEKLCRQIHESKQILSQTCVAVDVADSQVKIPFNLLLTRLTSLIEITIEEQKIQIAFRINPIQEIDQIQTSREKAD